MKLPSKTEMRLLEILAAQKELAGHEVAEQFEAATGRAISLGTLYMTLRRLTEQQWVRKREHKDADGRLRFFSMDARARAALNAAKRYQEAASALKRNPRSG